MMSFQPSHKTNIVCLVAIFAMMATGCKKNNDFGDVDFRQQMRDFVVRISDKAHVLDSDFIVIPQNGVQLISLGDDADAGLSDSYLAAIDGQGQEDLYYGYDYDDHPSPTSSTNELLAYLRQLRGAGKCVLVTDYCTKPGYVSDAHNRCDNEEFLSFAAPSRDLDVIPTDAPPHENANDITSLKGAQNFLYLINPEQFSSKSEFIESVCATNYDLIIMDLFFNDNAFTAAEVERMQRKANGGRRLLICYMSIGEAEDYRYYWQSSWSHHAPDWLDKENPSWKGNYKVRYWYSDWQDIICGSEDSYLNKIMKAHFDGVYLDIIDAFEYYEKD